MDEPILAYDSAPDYLKSADLHNLGSGTQSIFSSDYASNPVDAVAKFGIASIASGINSIYNSGVTVANWFGANASENDTASTLAGIDSDLGSYYRDNQASADTVGFIATSLIPGIGGVKLFNAGQKVLKAAQATGFVGSTFAKAVGLVPTLDQAILTAGESLAKSQSTFTLLNANVLNAIGSGFRQAAWESLAFEGMVNATMFKSPVLEGQDYKDIGANLLTATLVGGAIGGAFTAASSYGQIRKVIQSADIAQKPYTLLGSTANLTNPADRILVAANDLAVTPAMDQAATDGFEALRTKRLQLINNTIRDNTHGLVADDAALGNVIADTLQSMEPDQIANVVNGASKFVRPGKNVTLGEDEVAGWVKLWGDDKGNITWEKPSTTSIADRFKSVEEIDKFVNSNNFNRVKDWNIYTAGSPEEIQARYMWAKNATVTPGQVINSTDIPLLERALQTNVPVKVDDGFTIYAVDTPNLYNEVIQSKREIATELTKAKRAAWVQQIVDKDGRQLTTDDISKAVNVSKDFLENNEGASTFLRQDTQSQFDQWRATNGLKGAVDLDYVPSHFAAVYKVAPRQTTIPDSYLQSALVNVKYQQQVAQEAIDRAFVGISGSDLFNQVVHLSDKQIIETNRFGAGAGLFTFANGGYGTAASAMEQNGKVTANIIKKLSADTENIVSSPALALKGNKDAAVEFANINEQAARASGFSNYQLNDAGDGLILKAVAQNRADIQAGKQGVEAITVPDGIAPEIKFINPEVGDAIAARIERNGYRTSQRNLLAQAQGVTRDWDTDVLYPIKPDPKQMPFFAFVKDESLYGASNGSPTSMIHAADADKLQEMIDSIRSNENLKNFSVYTKQDTERFFKAQQDYEFDRTLHENYIDSSLKSQGVNSRFFPRTDPETIVSDWLNWESKQDSNLAREAMTAKLGNEFDQLHTLGQQFTDTASSRYAVNAKSVEASTQNPYLDYAKTALNISRLSEYPILTSLNRSLENAVGKVWGSVENAYRAANFNDTDLENVNATLQRAGVNHAYQSAAEVLLANHTAPKPVLSNFIRTANSILANTFLRTDPLNALNNAVGANVLLSAETTKLLQGIRNKDPALAGELSKLIDINVPGTQDTIQSAAKLIAGVMGDFVSGDTALAQYVKANGWSGRTGDLYRSMLQDLTLSGVGNETEGQMQGLLKTAFDKSKVLTDKLSVVSGNQLAEDFNRFVAAGVAKKISDLGVKGGLLDEASQLSYINTFVNRTQGNILASQRPLIFQGPIGQAIGLFQTFQFNTMQQLFRNVAEGGAKDAAMLLGMQGTLYGLNGLPAFQYINQHIIGTLSGNPDHKDMYSATYGVLGKDVGNWLMYGIPSNILQTNIYSRGDINPRRITVIPTNPADVVAVSAFGQFAANLKDTVTKLVNGGAVWETILQGFEHNQLSRPLAGLAQTLQATTNPGGKVYSTRNDGTLGFVNDFLSLATLSRLAGGKPLDEALANDEISRGLAYKAATKTNMKEADEAFRSLIIGGNQPPQDAVNTYLENFVKAGGQQADFNKHMLSVMTKVDTPRANQIIRTLKGPYAQRMQALLGGSVAQFDLGQEY